MARPFEAVSVLVALEYVVLTAILFVLVPLEAALPLAPLCLVFSYALYRYLS